MSLFRAYISSGKILNRNKRKHFYATKKALPERKVDCVLTVESLESERKKGIFFSRVNSFHASKEVSKKLYSGSQTVQSWRTHSLISALNRWIFSPTVCPLTGYFKSHDIKQWNFSRLKSQVNNHFSPTDTFLPWTLRELRPCISLRRPSL